MSGMRPRCSRIRRLGTVFALAPVLLGVASCGGSKPKTASSITPGGGVSGPQALLDHLPPINQFPNLHPISFPSVINSPGVWVATGGVPGTPGEADAARLERLGFVAAVLEELSTSSTTVAEVDAQVEQFHSASAATSELDYRFAQARGTGLSPGYTFGRFPVSGVPGAIGYAIKQPASSSDAVAFASGPYFYLMQSLIPSTSPNAVTPRQLSAEAAAWYQHLRKL